MPSTTHRQACTRSLLFVFVKIYFNPAGGRILSTGFRRLQVARVYSRTAVVCRLPVPLVVRFSLFSFVSALPLHHVSNFLKRLIYHRP